MRPKTPFAKPRTSQYRAPAFYWRGGDVLREREYVTDEYRKALSDLRRAQGEHQRVKAEVESASQVLHERDGYTSALAGFLDGDADGLIEENRLKAELVQLEQDIRTAEQQLKAKLALHNPGVAASLIKERAYYQIEIERELKALENTDEEIDGHKTRLAEIFSNPRYGLASELEVQYRKITQKRRFLRSLLNRTKNQFDSMTPYIPNRSNEAKTERTAMVARVEPRLALMQANERYERRPQKYTNYINFLVDQIDDLNVRMQEIGLEDDVVETEELRERAIASVARPPQPEPETEHEKAAGPESEAESEAEPETQATPEPEPKPKQVRVKKRRRVPKRAPLAKDGHKEEEQLSASKHRTADRRQERKPSHEITDVMATVLDVVNGRAADEEEEEDDPSEVLHDTATDSGASENDPRLGEAVYSAIGRTPETLEADVAEPMAVFGNALTAAITAEKEEKREVVDDEQREYAEEEAFEVREQMAEFADIMVAAVWENEPPAEEDESADPRATTQDEQPPEEGEAERAAASDGEQIPAQVDDGTTGKIDAVEALGDAIADAFVRQPEEEQSDGTGRAAVFTDVQTLAGVKPDTEPESEVAPEADRDKEPPPAEDVEFLSGRDDDAQEGPQLLLEETGTNVRAVPSAEEEGDP